MDTFIDDPLQAALAHAFEESPIIANTSTSPSSEPPPPAATVEGPVVDTPSSGSDGSDVSWKEDLERLSASWRAESAAAREKAEQERERRRIISEQEAAAAEVRKNREKRESEWESVIVSPIGVEKSHVTLGDEQVSTSRTVSTNPTTGDVNRQQLSDREVNQSTAKDSFNLLKPRFHRQQNRLPQDNTVYPQANVDEQTLSGSRTWDDVPSLDSSFPSFSMHDPSPPASDPPRRPPYQQPPEPPSVTLSIFDRTLSHRARILALTSSIAINLFLPFINGIMLGFGEIFAKNVVSYFGWELPGAGLGIRASFKRKKE